MYTKISFNSQTPTEEALVTIRQNLLAIGADHVESTDPRILLARGLVEVIAVVLKHPAAVDLLVVEVKQRQTALQGTQGAPDAGPCHCPTVCDVCHCVERGAVGRPIEQA